jgi:hypothetical protein
MATFKYATLAYNTESYTALQADLANHMPSYFVSVFVPIADITRGDETQGNGSAFTSPDTTLGYFVKYDETLTNLDIFNVASFSIIEDLTAWRQQYTIA